MDSTVELSDRTIVLEDSVDENAEKRSKRKETKGGDKLGDTIDLSSDEEADRDAPNAHHKDDDDDHFVTATASMIRSPQVTSTPNQIPAQVQNVKECHFGEVQDEFLHDESLVEAQSFTPPEDDSAIYSSKDQLPQKNGEDEDETSGEESDLEDNSEFSEDPRSTTTQSMRDKYLDKIELPDTCCLLKTKEGARVYLVGTAHFSAESQEDVVHVIRSVQPDVIMLELCKGRTNILHFDEETIMNEAKNFNFEKVVQTIKQNGAVQGVLYVLMLSMSAHLTRELGMAPGGEFRKAYQEAKHIPGCLVHLGDRPIQITLKRALASLTCWQKVKLAFNLLTTKENITKEDVERCKQKDLLESMLEEMAGEYPAMTQVFVQERDIYLAHSLQLAVDGPRKTLPGGTAAEKPIVVGVVGIGHLSGIQEHWGKVTPEDVAKVIKIPKPGYLAKGTKVALKCAFWTVTCYASYRLLARFTPVKDVVARLVWQK